MNNAHEEQVRDLLLEAFTAGWQAALAVQITNPRVLRVVEACFDLWLREAVDETEVLGFSFRSRDDLPGPLGGPDWPLPPPEDWSLPVSVQHRLARDDS